MDDRTSPGRPRFFFLLSVAYRRIQARSGDADSRTVARSGALMALPADGAAMPMKRLSEQLALGASSLSGLIDRMSADGLLTRVPDPVDGRAFNIALTAEGQAARADAVRGASALNERLCEGFSEEELLIVARWLEAAGTKFRKEKTP